MKKQFYAFIAGICFLAGFLSAETLQQAYQEALPGLGYDRLICLTPGEIYTGGLAIANEKVGIKGQGAILDLQGGMISATGSAVIDLDGCVVINGSRGLNLEGKANSLVTHCTFYGNQYGIYAFTIGIVEVMNTILANNTTYGFACDENTTCILHYLDAYQNPGGNYMAWCES